MLDEKRMAIERIQRLVKYFEDWEAEVTVESEDKKYFDTILNLIEKQSKEIEELKDTRSIFNMGRRSYKNEIEDKIKAKIEELEIEQESNREDLKIAIDNLSVQNIDKIANKISINMSIRGILQSLLEKE